MHSIHSHVCTSHACECNIHDTWSVQRSKSLHTYTCKLTYTRMRMQGNKSRTNVHDTREYAPPALDPSHYVHARIRVLYDDGAWYEGSVTGYDDKQDKFSVRLDDDTRFTTQLPDPDIEVISGPMSPRLGPHDPSGAVHAALL